MTKKFVFIIVSVAALTLSACGIDTPDVNRNSVQKLSLEQLEAGYYETKEGQQKKYYGEELHDRYSDIAEPARKLADVSLCHNRWGCHPGDYYGRIFKLGRALNQEAFTIEDVENRNRELIAFVKDFHDHKRWREY